MKPIGPALVTGASRGIGRGVALELANRGFDVVATMRDPTNAAELVTPTNAVGTIRVARLDVTEPGDFEMPSGLRVLVNNAGVEQANLPLEHTPIDHWRAMFETNVFGLVEVTKRAIPALRSVEGGVVCNITSSSLLVPMPFFGVYRASKAAVSALGESLQAELGRHGVRLVEVMPGPIDTDMLSASQPTPEAVQFDGYRELAELVATARRATIGDATSVRHAAGLIVDAILDDDAPLRVACDAMGEALLTAWSEAQGEALLRSYLDGFSTR